MVEGSLEETVGNVHLEDALISEFSLGKNESPDQYNAYQSGQLHSHYEGNLLEERANLKY